MRMYDVQKAYDKGDSNLNIIKREGRGLGRCLLPFLTDHFQEPVQVVPFLAKC